MLLVKRWWRSMRLIEKLNQKNNFKQLNLINLEV